jgi:hypothetical protein
MDMMGILAQSMMVATRSDTRIEMRDATPPGDGTGVKRYFWQGRKRRLIDPGKI